MILARAAFASGLIFAVASMIIIAYWSGEALPVSFKIHAICIQTTAVLLVARCVGRIASKKTN